ncbi:hypothetical protein K438DRAFT_1948177 [Mycena galopus ATCC 62051]|nr:hypothetical protein K438DRAFT_1948177 [Mycena galopus ATCC 62051]
MYLLHGCHGVVWTLSKGGGRDCDVSRHVRESQPKGIPIRSFTGVIREFMELTKFTEFTEIWYTFQVKDLLKLWIISGIFGILMAAGQKDPPKGINKAQQQYQKICCEVVGNTGNLKTPENPQSKCQKADEGDTPHADPTYRGKVRHTPAMFRHTAAKVRHTKCGTP